MVDTDKKVHPLNMKGKSAFQMAVFLKIINLIDNKIMKNNKDIIQQNILIMNEDVGGIVDVAKVKFQYNIIIKVDISLKQDENNTVIHLKITSNQQTTEIKIKRTEITTKMIILINHQKEDIEVLKLNNIIKDLILTNDLIEKDVNSIRQNVKSKTIMIRQRRLEQEKVT